MNALDFTVVAAYLVLMLGLGYFLRDQKNQGDFFLGGRSMGWLPLALSVMATQLSAISFVSAPGFVGLREGGGLTWLSYEFGVPLAMMALMLAVAPAVYRSAVISIYDLLESRIGVSTRFLVSAAFQITRSFATGIMVYAMGLILEAVVGIPFWQSVAIISVITIIYSLQGGMKAVVYTDAAQMVLIVLGLLACGYYAMSGLGGLGPALTAIDPARTEVINFDRLGFSGDQFGFWPMLLGGFVLYVSYYGADQTQAQRVLSARNLSEVRKLLLANGLLRFPVTLLYCLVGLAIGALVVRNPAVMAQIPPDRSDYMMPVFILEYLPHGLIGLLVVAILAAAMSSLSGVINSLAAVTADDMARLGFVPQNEKDAVARSRILAFAWGAIILAFSAFGGSIAPTVIEAINKVGSALYGPVLATFLLALFRPGTRALAANAGLVAGAALNLYLWRFAPEVFWMWWNLIGLVATGVIGFGLDATLGHRRRHVALRDVSDAGGIGQARAYSIVLAGYFGFIVLVSASLAFIAWG
ncbi:MAG: sodium/solute symporter [Gammaproteobacteria bacterium]|nr:sodium/solute symporter [Gammaproteobacteria bacterium]